MNPLSAIDSVGRIAVNTVLLFHSIVEGVFLSLYMFVWVEKKASRAYFEEILKQIYFTGVQAIWPTLLMALALGLFSALYSNSDLMALGNEHALSRILAQLCVAGLGPIVIALLVIARSCTAVASELGTMKVNHEIDTLRIICKDPHAFLVFPRIFGGCVAVICLGVIFTLTQIFTYCTALYAAEEVSPFESFQALTTSWGPGFIFLLISKYALPALAIFAIATRQGLSVKRSSHEVPIVTSGAVLQSLYVAFACHTTIAFIQYSNFFGGIW